MEVVALTAPLFALVFAGFAVQKIFGISEKKQRVLTLYVVFVALPALLFQLLRSSPADVSGSLSFVVATSSATFATFLAAYFLARWGIGRSLRDSTIMGLAGAYGNIGYMGPALTLAAFGESSAAPTALILCFDNILMFTLAPLLVAVSEKDEPWFAVLPSVVAKVVTHPFIVAIALGQLTGQLGIELPGLVDTMIGALSLSAAPCALFVMGMVVGSRSFGFSGEGVIPACLVKLFLHPLLVWGFLNAVGDFDPVWVSTAVLMAALPSALNVFVYAKHYGAFVEEASAVVLGTTCASVLTVSGILYLLLPGK